MLRVSVAALHPPAVTAELYKINYLPDLETCGLTRGAMCYMVKVLKSKVEEICAERLAFGVYVFYIAKADA